MGHERIVDYEGLRQAAAAAIVDKSRTEVARERYVSVQAVCAACNTADHGMTKLQIRLIETYSDYRVVTIEEGTYRLERREP